MKLVLLGNAGAGKSTIARRLIGGRQIPRLSLDEIAWDPGPQRKPLHESLELLNDFHVTVFAVVRDPKQSRSEEHMSELQSRFDLVCRLLLEKKNDNC